MLDTEDKMMKKLIFALFIVVGVTMASGCSVGAGVGPTGAGVGAAVY